MKHTLTIPLFSAALCLGALPSASRAEDDPSKTKDKVEYALILPEEKTPELVKPAELNPFENASTAQQEDAANSEQNRIKEVLMSLPPVGMSRTSAGKLVAYIGDIRLEEKALVPKVLEDQTLDLRVKEITPRGVTLVWVEKKPTGLPPREELIPMDIAPSVTVNLPGRSGRTASGEQGAAHAMGRQQGRTARDVAPAPSALLASDPGSTPRAVPVEEQELPKMNVTPPQPPNGPASDTGSPASALMNLLFGNPVKNGQPESKQP